MRKIISIFTLFSAVLISSINAQTLGAKKNITLKLMGYECGDFCNIELIDVKSGVSYDMNNIDEKTKDNGILDAIQEYYYKNGESINRLKGKTYKALVEYRKTDIWRTENTEEPPVKTGKKKTLWMINSLTK